MNVPVNLTTVTTLFQPKLKFGDRKFKVLRTIGEGGFAYVYQVRDVHHRNQNYAVKKMICQTNEQMNQAIQEIQLCSKISKFCTYVIPLLDSYITLNKKGQKEVYLLLPLYKESVQSIIDAGSGYPSCCFNDGLDVVKILRHCVEAIIAIHAAGYRHGDLKPGNILLNEYFDAVVTDFGSASPLEVKVTNRNEAIAIQEYAAQYSTASYRSPELHSTPSQCVIDGKSDVWSFGCLMYCLCFSRTPFETSHEGLSTLSLMAGQFVIPTTQTVDESKSSPPIESYIWPQDYVEIIQKCLTVDVNERLPVGELQIRLKRLSGPPLDLSTSQRSKEFASLQTPLSSMSEYKAENTLDLPHEIVSISSPTVANFADFTAIELIKEHGDNPATAKWLSIVSNYTSDSDSSDPFNDGSKTIDPPFVTSKLNPESKHPDHPQTGLTTGTASNSARLEVMSPPVVGPIQQEITSGVSQSEASNGGESPESSPYSLLESALHSSVIVREDEDFSNGGQDFENEHREDDFTDFTDFQSSLPPGNNDDVRRLDKIAKALDVENRVEELDMLSLIKEESILSSKVIRQGVAFTMRLGGFPKKMTKKKVWMVLTASGITVRKDSNSDSKILEIFSLHRPISLTPSDTLSIGLNGLIIVGGSPQNPPKTTTSQSHPSNELEWVIVQTNSTANADSKLNQKQYVRSPFVTMRFELSFESKDVLNEWMDAIINQSEALN